MNAIMGAHDAHTAMSTQASGSETVRRERKDVLLNHAGLPREPPGLVRSLKRATCLASRSAKLYLLAKQSRALDADNLAQQLAGPTWRIARFRAIVDAPVAQECTP